MFVVLLSAKRH